jgi:hypothetical protein
VSTVSLPSYAPNARHPGDGDQRPLVPRSRCPPRLMPGVRCQRHQRTNPKTTHPKQTTPHHEGQDNHPRQHTKTHTDKSRAQDHHPHQRRQCPTPVPTRHTPAVVRCTAAAWEAGHPYAGGEPLGRRLRAGRRAKEGGGCAPATRSSRAAPNIPVERTAHSAGF